MYDNKHIDDFKDVFNKVIWLERKTAFRDFLIKDLNISDSRIISRLLDEFDEGLNANIDFRMLMLACGYNEEFIDEVIAKYNYGEKPTIESKGYYIEDSYVTKEVLKSSLNERVNFTIKPYSLEQKAKLRSEVMQLFTNYNSMKDINGKEIRPSLVTEESIRGMIR